MQFHTIPARKAKKSGAVTFIEDQRRILPPLTRGYKEKIPPANLLNKLIKRK
jgi:hypothetical protein